MKITGKSREQYLQDLIRHISTHTDIDDFNPGSQIVTLLEGVASNMFKLNTDLLRTLEMRDLDFMSDEQLDILARDMYLPNGQGGTGRLPALKSSGKVIFTDESIEKQETFFYSNKPAPFSGTSSIFVQDATNFPDSGFIYIGRGTQREEGPIEYISKIHHGNYFTLILNSTLVFDHVYQDKILLSQGGTRVIPKGTTVSALNTIPQQNFVTDREVKILDGETSVDVNVTASDVGAIGNISANKINHISNTLQLQLSVHNPYSFTSGRDVENTSSLRDRIKTWQRTLSKGTTFAIVNSLKGFMSNNDTIHSAKPLPQTMQEPLQIVINNLSLLEPEIENYDKEILTLSTTIAQKVFTVQKKPIAPVHIISDKGNYQVSNGQYINIILDNRTYTYYINENRYKNILDAKPYEIVNDFNSQNDNIISFYLVESGSKILATSFTGERIECLVSTLQQQLGFPTGERRSIYLYVNDQLQNNTNIKAELISSPRDSWNLLGLTIDSEFTCSISVNGVIINATINNNDFLRFGVLINNATAEQWSKVLATKIAGCTITTRDNRIVITLDSEGYLEILESDWLAHDSVFNPLRQTYSKSIKRNYSLNRFTGEIQFLEPLEVNSKVEIATVNTRANINSQQTINGNYSIFNEGQFVYPSFVVCSGDAIEKFIIPTENTEIDIVGNHDSNTISLVDTNNEQIFNVVEVDDSIILTVDQDANTHSVDFKKINNIYKVVKKKINNGNVQEVILLATNQQINEVNNITTPLKLTTGMISIFKGCYNSEYINVDENLYNTKSLAESLNSKLTNYSVVAPSGSRVRLQAKKYTTERISILKVFGNASRIFNESTGVKVPINHISNITSSKVNSIPQHSEVVEYEGYKSFQKYIKFDTFKINVDDNIAQPESLPLSNSFQLLNSSNTSPIYPQQTESPFNSLVPTRVNEHNYITVDPIIANSPDVRDTIVNNDNYNNISVYTQGLNITQNDQLIFNISNNNVPINLHKRYQIESITHPSEYKKGSIVSLTLKDPDVLQNVLDETSGLPIFDIYHPLRRSTLEGCKLITRSMCFYTNDTSTIILKNREYGEQNKVGFNILYAKTDEQDLTIKHSNVYQDNSVNVIITAYLPSDEITNIMNEGYYNLTWGTESDGLVEAHFSSKILATFASVEKNNITATAKSVGSVGNGVVINFVNNATKATAFSGTLGIEYEATDTGADYNDITIETIDSGSGGLSITEDTVARTIIIDLGGNDSVTRVDLQNYPNQPVLINFIGDGFSDTLDIHGPQILTGGSGGEISINEDINEINIDLGSNTVTADQLISFLDLNPNSLVNFTGSGSDIIPTFTMVTNGGSDEDPGILDTFIEDDVIVIPTNDLNLPIGTWKIESVNNGAVVCKIPNYNNKTDISNINASQFAITSFKTRITTVKDIFEAVKEYCQENNLADVELIESDIIQVDKPLFLDKQLSTNIKNTLTDVIYNNIVKGVNGGEAAIFKFDPDSDIQAVLKTDEFLPKDEINGFTYIPNNADIIVVPDNLYSLELWLKTHIHSVLSSFVNIEKTNESIVINAQNIGSQNFIELNSTPSLLDYKIPLVRDAIMVQGLGMLTVDNKFSESLNNKSILKIENKINQPKHLPFDGANPFNNRRAIYTRDSVNKRRARIIFLREGQYDTVSENRLKENDQVEFTILENGLVKINIVASDSVFNARSGEMLCIYNDSIFPSEYICTQVSTGFNTSFKNGNLNYVGYPVIHADSTEVVIIAPNITTGGVFTLSGFKDLLFVPSLYCEKNFKNTNSAGVKFDSTNDLYGAIKSFSSNIYSLTLSHGVYSTDDLMLDQAGVQTGDLLVLGNSFPTLHQGKHRIIGYGRNIIFFENKNGGGQVTGLCTEFDNDSQGSIRQMIKVEEKHVTILDMNSLQIGSVIEIPQNNAPWFDNSLIGKNTVIDFGYTYTLNDVIPSASNNIEELCFWIELEFIKNAPEQTVITQYTDFLNHYSDTFSSYCTIEGSAKTNGGQRNICISPLQNRFIGISQGTTIKSLSKLPFTEETSISADGYSIVSGLIKDAHDFLEGDYINEGWIAAGSQIEILAPVPHFISLNVELELVQTVSRKTIEGVVKTSLIQYISALSVSENVYISALTAVCQKITGVKSVNITSNTTMIQGGIIQVSEKSKPVLRMSDITINTNL